MVHDFNAFVIAQAHHTALIKEWKHDIEIRRDRARSYLIGGADTLDVREDETQIEVVTAEIPTSPFKIQKTTVPPVSVTAAVLLPTKMDIVKTFTLNNEQKFAFMIVTSHLDGDSPAYTGKLCTFS